MCCVMVIYNLPLVAFGRYQSIQPAAGHATTTFHATADNAAADAHHHHSPLEHVKLRAHTHLTGLPEGSTDCGTLLKHTPSD